MSEYYYFLSPVAILTSATVAGYIALNVAKKQKAIEFILNTKSDDRVQEGLAVIRKIHVNQHDDIVKYAYSYQKDPQSTIPEDDELQLKEHFERSASAIRYTLNHFEYMAVGIAEGIYCETILNRSMRTTIVRLYERTEKFIHEARIQSGQKSAHIEFESLAKRWDDHDKWEENKKPIHKILNPCSIISQKL